MTVAKKTFCAFSAKTSEQVYITENTLKLE